VHISGVSLEPTPSFNDKAEGREDTSALSSDLLAGFIDGVVGSRVSTIDVQFNR